MLKMFVQVAKTRCIEFLLCSIKFTMTFLTSSPSLNAREWTADTHNSSNSCCKLVNEAGFVTFLPKMEGALEYLESITAN